MIKSIAFSRTSFVFASTTQQSEGNDIKKAKGIGRKEHPKYNTVVVDEAARVVEKILHVHDYKVINDREIRIYSNEISRSELNRTLVEQGIEVDEIFETGIGLEDYFKSLIA